MVKTIMIGCDLHDRSMLVRFAIDTAEPQQRTFPNDFPGREKMIQFFRQLAAEHDVNRTVFTYEASGLGFGLCDLLHDYGIECHVLSPTKLEKSAKSAKQKTDAKDAQLLLEKLRGFVLAGNDLPVVWTPPPRLRDDRELVRSRTDTADDCTRIKLKILSMLKRRGIEKPKAYRGSNWSKSFVKWLNGVADQLDPCVGSVLKSLVRQFELYRDEIAILDKRIRELSRTDRYRHAHEELRKLVGVGLLTAMTFLTEMGDLLRFKNRRQVAAYLGLCPASFESGEADDRKGHITRQGPSRLRRVLCQAAWTAVTRDKETAAAYHRIQGPKGQRKKKALVAIMRRLVIRMWHKAAACGVSTDLCGRGGPHSLKTSAQAQQRGAVPIDSPSPRPLAG